MTLEIDRDAFEVKVNRKVVNLSPKEYELLVLLSDTPGKVFTREQIKKSIWNDESVLDFDTRTVDQHVCRLRRKTHKDIIKTVTTRGYIFKGSAVGN